MNERRKDLVSKRERKEDFVIKAVFSTERKKRWQNRKPLQTYHRTP